MARYMLYIRLYVRQTFRLELCGGKFVDLIITSLLFACRDKEYGNRYYLSFDEKRMRVPYLYIKLIIKFKPYIYRVLTSNQNLSWNHK